MLHIFSRLISLLLIILFSPILILISFIIIIKEGRPILFRQKRIGLNNNYFYIYKFRTMHECTPDIPTHLVKKEKLSYTSTGPFLRKYSLDELPQLFNILKGEMVFIGPRPALFNQSKLIHLRTEKNIQNLMPGVTGWAQINGRDELSIQDKVLLDEAYLKNKSLRLDFLIIFKTIFKVFKAEGVIK